MRGDDEPLFPWTAGVIQLLLLLIIIPISEVSNKLSLLFHSCYDHYSSSYSSWAKCVPYYPVAVLITAGQQLPLPLLLPLAFLSQHPPRPPFYGHVSGFWPSGSRWGAGSTGNIFQAHRGLQVRMIVCFVCLFYSRANNVQMTIQVNRRALIGLQGNK